MPSCDTLPFACVFVCLPIPVPEGRWGSSSFKGRSETIPVIGCHVVPCLPRVSCVCVMRRMSPGNAATIPSPCKRQRSGGRREGVLRCGHTGGMHGKGMPPAVRLTVFAHSLQPCPPPFRSTVLTVFKRQGRGRRCPKRHTPYADSASTRSKSKVQGNNPLQICAIGYLLQSSAGYRSPAPRCRCAQPKEQ
jgi:hypothetical protein